MEALRRQLAPVSGWRFLTAQDADALAPVLADFGQDARAADAVATGRIDHVLKVFLVDGQRRVRNVYSAEFLDPRLLLNDARTVLREANATALP
jgi:cytochrome c peroxidase